MSDAAEREDRPSASRLGRLFDRLRGVVDVRTSAGDSAPGAAAVATDGSHAGR